MMLRARHLFLTWLATAGLQLALLGGGDISTQAGVGSRGARAAPELLSVALAKHILNSDASARYTPAAPFAPSEPFRLDAPALSGHEAHPWRPRQVLRRGARLLPPSRAPPALS